VPISLTEIILKIIVGLVMMIPPMTVPPTAMVNGVVRQHLTIVEPVIMILKIIVLRIAVFDGVESY
jgi:hypothetical protein